MTSRFRNIKNDLVIRLGNVSEECFLIAGFLKSLDIDEMDSVKELKYLGGCVENRMCDLDKIMDETFDLANKMEIQQALPDPDNIALS